MKSFLATAALLLAHCAWAEDLTLARNLAATCATCHGTQGHAAPNAALSSLAGQDAALLMQKLKAFRDGTLPATVMHQIAKGYTDSQLDLIARYFAAQK